MENKRTITEQDVAEFRAWLVREEKSSATVEQYLRGLRSFMAFAGEHEVTKELVIEWKESLVAGKYEPATVNSRISGLRNFLNFRGWGDCSVKSLKIQQKTYTSEEKELTMEEYERLLDAADPQLRLIMETIAGTGIRVSELRFFTVEAVQVGEVKINNKGKLRSILLPLKLQRKLLRWAKKKGIRSGAIFVTRSGKPLDRSNIWSRMKKLCEKAGVAASKVFPHNLRKLFARHYYETHKDIAKLADILGHSSINTTRIYIMTTGKKHRQQLDELGLVS